MNLIIDSPKHGRFKVFYDKEDHALIASKKWRIIKYNQVYYCAAGTERVIYMHLLVMGFPTSKVDHIDGDGLNNRKSNLRLAEHHQNLQNRGKPSNNTTGYKGVFFCKQTGKFRVIIRANNKQYEGGRFDDKILAAKKYNELAVKYHGEFAKLNPV